MNGGNGNAGFTLREMLVLILLTSCAAGILAAGAHQRQIDSRSVRCLGNLRQHGMALQLYAADFKGLIPSAENPFSTPGRPEWLGRFYSIDYSSKPENWNPAVALSSSPINPYTKTNYSIWRCPADPSRVRNASGQFVPRVRTYSMSQTFGSGNWLPVPRYRTFSHMQEIPNPARIWMVMDEHPDSINDGGLAVEMVEPHATSGRIIDYPGSHHNGGVGILYSDGHVEAHTWKGKQIRPPVRGTFPSINVTGDSLPDLKWLSERTSVLR